MNTIYVPKGRAFEYSPLSLNIYDGCEHSCKYCYVKQYQGKWEKDWPNVSTPRSGIVEGVERKLLNLAKKGVKLRQVLLSFQGDPYNPREPVERVTRKILELFLVHHVPVAILTKGGSRCLQDLSLFKQFGPNIKVGQTITFASGNKSLEWEPGATLPLERQVTAETLKAAGIRTWASFEPVIEIEESLAAMEMVKHAVDEVKIGKINYFPEMERGVEWARFLYDAIQIFDKNGVDVYVKKSLQSVSGGKVNLSEKEKNADAHHLPEWRDQ